MNTTATCASSSGSSESASAGEYLARFGLDGAVGRFRAAAGLAPGRGALVVLRTPRGLELGSVLRPAGRRHAAFDPDAPAGELLRLAGAEDEEVAEAMAERARALLARGAELIEEQRAPVELLDAEVLLDGRLAVVQHVAWGEADLRELVRPLSRELGLSVSLKNVGRPAEAPGCGSCGEGGCGDGGCGSGGCGSSCGSVSAEEVRAHFAALREQMERRVSLL
jgi:cell fate regulator YaaT (PSP1 superfamily)